MKNPPWQHRKGWRKKVKRARAWLNKNNLLRLLPDAGVGWVRY